MTQKNYKHATLKAAFPNKRLVRIIACRKECPLQFKQRLVLSSLIWRFRNRPVSVLRLHEHTRLDRSQTLPQILAELKSLGLATQTGNRWAALKPPEHLRHWFAAIKCDGPLEKWFGYNWLPLPASKSSLTIIDCAVLAADLLRPGTIPAFVAGQLGVHPDTIKRARLRIKKLGELSLSWLSDNEPKQSRPAAARISKETTHEHPPMKAIKGQATDPVEYIQNHRRISDKYIVNAMRHAVRSLSSQGISESRDIISLLNAVLDRWGNDESCFESICGWHSTTMPKLMAEHRFNRQTSNGVGLLLYNLRGGKKSASHDDEDGDETNAA